MRQRAIERLYDDFLHVGDGIHHERECRDAGPHDDGQIAPSSPGFAGNPNIARMSATGIS
jgi:hypothetical protein